MQKTLGALIELQEVDNRLDELMEERGDLPQIVDELEEKLATANDSQNVLNTEIKTAKVRIKELEKLLNEAIEKLKKYNDQLYQVKTNKEYDAITNEIETVQEDQQNHEQEQSSIEIQVDENLSSVTEIEAEIAKVKEELSENRKDLDERLAETADEETKLNKRRAKILKNVSKHVLNTYETIRSAREGKGIAFVMNGNCGGCFSYIPPQKVVEVRKMKKMFECEACGRILVWNEQK